ncbi:MAG: hypothetical protein J2P37_06055, partial [Ktedonobacteraceae bacterium]|nr:hypothetical protein [Ktedonobacteraceae bacterium]
MITILQPLLVQHQLNKVIGPEPSANPSYILHEKARQYYWEGKSPLSIKAFFSGQAFYTLGSSYCTVDDTSYLVVNHDQPYAINIDAGTPVESFCLFFEPGFAEEVYRSLTTPTYLLLDEPERPDLAPLHFFERTYRHDDLLSPALFSLRAMLHERGHGQTWLHERFHGLMQQLLQVHFNVYKEISALPAVRATTREELYRRLYRAREYASALLDTPITLSDMA